MKYFTLISSALLLLGLNASAQEVIDIPCGEWALDPAKATITIMNPTANLEDDDPDNDVEKPRYKETDDEGHNQFDNMRDGDYAEFRLNNTEESAYIVKFQTACKKDAAKLVFQLSTADGDLDWEDTYSVTNNGNWGKWLDVTLFITDPIEKGEKTLKITFQEEGGKETVNLRNLRFEAAQGELRTYSLYTYIEVDGVETPEAGTLTVSPSQPQYMTGTEITVTATPNLGYKFIKFVDQYDDEYIDNPYKFVIEETTDLIAVFEKVELGNKVPGEIDVNSRYYRAYGKVQSMDIYDEETETTNTFYYLGDYRSAVSSKGVTQFEQNVQKTANYDLSFQASTKTNVGTLRFVITDDATLEADPEAAPEYDQTFQVEITGNWTKFAPYTYHDVNLTAGMKMLTIYFDTTAADGDKDYKYTCNVGGIRFSLPGGEEDGIQSVVSTTADSAAIYDLQGRALQSVAAPGVYVRGGKKIVMK